MGTECSCHGDQRSIGMPDSDVAMLKEAFELFDTDNSGTIDSAELKFCMQALDFSPTDKEIADMMVEIDTDGNNTIEFQEFVDLMAARMSSKNPEEELAKGFTFFDRDGKVYHSSGLEDSSRRDGQL